MGEDWSVPLVAPPVENPAPASAVQDVMPEDDHVNVATSPSLMVPGATDKEADTVGVAVGGG